MQASSLLSAPLAPTRAPRALSSSGCQAKASPSLSLPSRGAIDGRRSRASAVITARREDGGVYNDETGKVEYGNDWYSKTRGKAATGGRSAREEMMRRREANYIANNGRDREDLYTDNWDGSEWKGGSTNILTVIGALFILTPVAGLAFAYFTYGELWG